MQSIKRRRGCLGASARATFRAVKESLSLEEDDIKTNPLQGALQFGLCVSCGAGAKFSRVGILILARSFSSTNKLTVRNSRLYAHRLRRKVHNETKR